MSSSNHSSPSTPYRQIRAHQPTRDTIIVYQAYNASIAAAAVSSQSLSASPLFRPGRMTWIKPSWCWVCYRSGYAQKDANQARILALEMTVDGFCELLSRGVLADEKRGEEGEVRIQWDPERGPRLEKLQYRSVQIGIPGTLVAKWIDEWIVGIKDVTETAKEMQKVVETDENVPVEELLTKGLHPMETVFEIEMAIRKQLRMDMEV